MTVCHGRIIINYSVAKDPEKKSSGILTNLARYVS